MSHGMSHEPADTTWNQLELLGIACGTETRELKVTLAVALRCFSVVISAGFEPTTPGLGILCSIRLSYGTSHADEYI